jgi:hypothetical protein
MADYQVWHREGASFNQVAIVQSQELLGALVRTQHGVMAERWQDIEGVSAMPGEHRSTTFGDIIIAPDGKEWKFAPLKMEGIRGELPGFEPTDAIQRQEMKAISAEIRADEQAARVRDYGEADAATYDQRVEEGAKMMDWEASGKDYEPIVLSATRDPEGEIER